MSSAAEKYEEEEYEIKKPFFLRRLPWGGFTYNEYMKWDEEILWELIDGIPYMMAPPVIKHQERVGEMYSQLKEYFKGKPCKVIVSPIGVRLFPSKKGDDKHIVLPDVVVVCDEEKLSDGKMINGPPDFVVEVVSPSSKGHDKIYKKELYEAAGIREYWVVDEDKIYKYVLVNKAYEETIIEITKGLAVKLSVLRGCAINF